MLKERLVNYVTATTNLGIKYSDLPAGHPHLRYKDLGLFGYIDASYNGPHLGKSVGGFVFFMVGRPFAWAPKLIEGTPTAVQEAEISAAVRAVKEAAWIRNFLTELGEMPEGPLT